MDGTDPELVREILENEIDGMAARHHAGMQPFEKAGGFAPTMGIIGTVMGLISVLQNLNDPGSLGPSISVRLHRDALRRGRGERVCLPVANRSSSALRARSELRTMTLEGILAIQAGDNPRVVADKLLSVHPARRARGGGGQRGGGGESALAASCREPEMAAGLMRDGRH